MSHTELARGDSLATVVRDGGPRCVCRGVRELLHCHAAGRRRGRDRGLRNPTYVGRREGERLLYAGKVRSGSTEAVARDLRERLDPFIRKDPPLSEPVKKPKATGVEPVIEAEIAYSTVTENNLLREAVFKGLRQDRDAPGAAHTPGARASRAGSRPR